MAQRCITPMVFLQWLFCGVAVVWLLSMLYTASSVPVATTPSLPEVRLRAEVMRLKHDLASLKRQFRNYAMWRPDPWFSHTDSGYCRDRRGIGGANDNENYYVCFDGYEKEGCVVYDVGIRKEAELGLEMAETYGCEVHAFDPSETTKAWIAKGALEGRGRGRFHFHDIGIAGHDGTMKVWQSDWQQVTVQRPFPNAKHPMPWKLKTQEWDVHVRSVVSMMRELQHEKLFILKVDVEGSEYLILQAMLDAFPRKVPIDVILLEFHHFDVDSRYGLSPHINLLLGELEARGFHVYMLSTMWSNDDSGATKYQQIYLCQHCLPPQTNSSE